MELIRKQAVQILANADELLRGLIASAATEGDLSGVDFAREIAGRVRQIMHSVESKGRPASETDLRPARPASGPAVAGRSKGKLKVAYPKYYLRNGALCRLGWSKKRRNEYEHKVRKNVVDQTVTALAKVGRSTTGPHTVEGVITEINSATAMPAPSYQVYVAIGFLKEFGCIQRVGRDGYQVPPDLSAKAAAAWQRLVESNGETGT